MRQLILPIFIFTLTSCDFVTQSKSEPAITIAPVTKPSKFDTNDSSFLKLEIKEDKFEINFLNKVSVLDNINKLDTFFQTNTMVINKDKIVIVGFDTVSKNKNVTELLKKHGISKFRILEE